MDILFDFFINMTTIPTIYVAVPAMNESKLLPRLINDIFNQNYRKFQIVVCINQPDEWWGDISKKNICLDNQKTIKYLNSLKTNEIHIIDKSSIGNGWKGKNYGVGWARKIAMDYIMSKASDDDIIVSIDADTQINCDYFSSIVDSFNTHQKIIAISVPYFHKLTEDNLINRCILRYEIYMRLYSINLWRTKVPYHFTALGSAICIKAWAYKKVGGITPLKSGEDFYFLQKLAKSGTILNWNPEKVYPETRYSNRVFFGTGPALIKGRNEDWSSYPIYHFSLFNKLSELYNIFHKICSEKLNNNDYQLLNEFSIDNEWWQNLKINFKTERHFVKACSEKFDALRILQFLKSKQPLIRKTDEECLIEYLSCFHKDIFNSFDFKDFNFKTSSIHFLDAIRKVLLNIEEEFQKNEYFKTKTTIER